jgi:predicted DNA-binding transcriptional regulator AlpA
VIQGISPEHEGFVQVSRLLRERRWPWGRSKTYALIAAGKLPRPIKLSPKLTAYPESVVRRVQDAVKAGEFNGA